MFVIWCLEFDILRCSSTPESLDMFYRQNHYNLTWSRGLGATWPNNNSLNGSGDSVDGGAIGVEVSYDCGAVDQLSFTADEIHIYIYCGKCDEPSTENQ